MTTNNISSIKTMNKSISVVVFVLFAIAFVNCQSLNDIDVNDGLKKLEENIPELQNFNKTNLPKMEDVEKVLRDKCSKNGADDAVDELKNEQDAAKMCVEQYVNATILQEELENAKSTGSMDEVFGKYCKRWPQMYACFENATTTARQCMDNEEEAAFNKTLVILNDLQEFLCFKDGDRLAMFVAEGGIECMQSRKEGLQECVNTTLGERIPDTDDLSITSLPTFFYSAKDCQDFDTLRTCFNEELEKCSDSTPANIIDALFKFIKKQMPCGPDKSINKKVNAAAAAAASSSNSYMTVSSSVFLVFGAILSLNFWL